MHRRPNYASDLVVTRLHPKVSGLLQVLGKYRKDENVYGMLGAMLREKEHFISQREISTLVDGLIPKDKGSEDVRKRVTEILVAEKNEFWKVVQSGIVDDMRTTDNAWVESTFYHVHLDTDKLKSLANCSESDLEGSESDLLFKSMNELIESEESLLLKTKHAELK